MHPMERLRHVARASGVPQAVMVREAAGALAQVGHEPAALLTACRRVLDRQPASGPLVHLAARMLTADDARNEAWQVVDEIDTDPTGIELTHAFEAESRVAVLGWPVLVGEALVRRGDVTAVVIDALGEGSGLVMRLIDADADPIDVPLSGLGAAVANADVVVLEALAGGPDGFLVPSGARAAAATARHAEVPIWIVAGRGTILPNRMWQGLLGRQDLRYDPWDLDEEVVPIDLVDQVVGPAGLHPVAAALTKIDCPITPELF